MRSSRPRSSFRYPRCPRNDRWPHARRRPGALAHRLNIAPEDADEIANVKAVEQHMTELMRVPTVGAGESLETAVAGLEKDSALLVLDSGAPVGILTRSDVLGFLASH